MPKLVSSIKIGSALSAPNGVLSRPKIASLLGAISAEFGRIENMLSEVFNIVLYQEIEPKPYTKNKNLSDIVFKRISSVVAKMDVNQKLIKECYSTNVSDSFEELRVRIGKFAKTRNNLIHVDWNLNENYPEDLIWMKLPKQWEVYTPEDFENYLRTVTEISADLNQFIINISYERKVKFND